MKQNSRYHLSNGFMCRNQWNWWWHLYLDLTCEYAGVKFSILCRYIVTWMKNINLGNATLALLNPECENLKIFCDIMNRLRIFDLMKWHASIWAVITECKGCMLDYGLLKLGWWQVGREKWRKLLVIGKLKLNFPFLQKLLFSCNNKHFWKKFYFSLSEIY